MDGLEGSGDQVSEHYKEKKIVTEFVCIAYLGKWWAGPEKGKGVGKEAGGRTAAPGGGIGTMEQ